MMKNEEKMILR